MEAIQDLIANLVPLIQVGLVLLGAYIILIWAASVLWAYRDIRRRSEDTSVQVLAVSMVLLLPFAGILLHIILRPPQTIAEKYERELEQEYLRRDIEEKYVCPECQRPIEPDFLLCPHCQAHLRRRCGSCERVVDLTWSVCPYCGDDGASSNSRQAATIAGAVYPALRSTK
ncbi:MAG: zinc ribbon domain-containing protein [Candidatus Viridilinea halotolerans]|uniref:Zinc ribbon domain-containing protein n=1 Tax=Candidatus Viridilinea halotolerans TaxID=2491704 RepID=A0A426UB08_9CHLR|nr:MAG: zinc ribbon domain-containing protein [Candidatus Viridilinea halotolerans]